MANWWTNKDLEILRDIYSKPQSIEKQMHRLPDRTTKAAKNQAKRIGLVKMVDGQERMRDRALHIIDEHGPVSVDALAKLMSRSRQTASSLIRQLRKEGRIHIAGFDAVKRKRNWSVQLWGAGAGKNATRQVKTVEKAQIDKPIPARTFVMPRRDELTSAFFGACA